MTYKRNILPTAVFVKNSGQLFKKSFAPIGRKFWFLLLLLSSNEPKEKLNLPKNISNFFADIKACISIINKIIHLRIILTVRLDSIHFTRFILKNNLFQINESN